MKTTRNILAALIAAGTPGVAVLTLTDRIPADLVLAGLTALGLFAFAIDDFSRHPASLRVRAAIIRPPVRAAGLPVSDTLRTAA